MPMKGVMCCYSIHIAKTRQCMVGASVRFSVLYTDAQCTRDAL